ncbi:MAG: hypothetical protein HKP32_01130, partial [Woeseia sp.]|nr:hypothetical protein [Woeseia sp.]
ALANQSASLTERELRSLRETVKEQHANGLGLRAEFMGPVPARHTLTRSLLATSMPPRGASPTGRVATDPLRQGAALPSAATQADAQNKQTLVSNSVAIRDGKAPVLTSRLNGIPSIVSAGQQGLPERITLPGDALAPTVSPRALSLPQTMAPLDNGLPETRITLHGAPQSFDVDADLKSLQRMLAPSMLHSIPTSPAAAAPSQTAATFTPVIPGEVVRPDTGAQNFTRGAQPVTILTNGSQATDALPVDSAAQNPARGGQPIGLAAGAAQVAVNPSTLSDSIKAALPAQIAAPINQAATLQAQPNAVPPVPVVAAPRYAKPSVSNNVTTPAATVAVAATPGPDLQPVDAAAPRPETSNVTLASATALTAPQPAATTSGATSPPALNLPVTDNAWGNALSERVAVLAGQKITSADIRLNPAELGPLRVEIKVDDGNAQVHFVAQHAVTRDAIEQALPRLRELLAAEGLNLTGADVSEQGVARDRGESSQQARSSDKVNDGETDELQSGKDEPLTRTPDDSLVDTFA